MATSGRDSARGGRLRPAAASTLASLGLLLAVLTTVGCNDGRLSDADAFSCQKEQSLPTPQTSLAPGWVHVPAPAGWKRALRDGVMPLSRVYSIGPIALGGDGHTLFATLHSKKWYGVVRIDARTSRFIRIHAFDDPVNDQAGGSFDGRWLVWTEWNSPSDFSNFAVWSWDSRTGRVRRIGAAIRSGDGFWPGSWEHVVARGGYAAWQQGSGPYFRGQLHVYDLAAGRDRIVREGYLGPPVFIGNRTLLYSEGRTRNAAGTWRCIDIQTRAPLPVPLGLRQVQGACALAVDHAFAYVGDWWQSLWWSPSLDSKPRKLLSVPEDASVGNPIRLCGSYLYFNIQPRDYIANIRTRRFLQVPGGGWPIMDKTSFVLVPPNPRKAMHLVSDIVFLPMSKLRELLP